jgi:hypothetical protein
MKYAYNFNVYSTAVTIYFDFETYLPGLGRALELIIWSVPVLGVVEVDYSDCHC